MKTSKDPSDLTNTDTASTKPPRRGRGRPKHTEPSEKFQLRKQQILLSFEQEFAKRGYHQTSIQDVADSTGILKANIYYYFPSKGHILYALMEQSLDDSLAVMEGISDVENPKDAIKLILRRHVNAFAKRAQVVEIFLADRPNIEGEAVDRVTIKHRKYLDYLAQATKRGIDAGILPKGNPKIISIAIFAMPSMVYHWVDDLTESSEEVLRILCALIGLEL